MNGSFKLMSFKQLHSYVIKLSLNNRFDIGTVICPRAVVLALGLRPRANTTALRQITVPISNLLFNNIYYYSNI